MNSDDFPALKAANQVSAVPLQRQMLSFSSVAASGTKKEDIRPFSGDNLNDFPALPSTNPRQRSDEELLSFMSARDPTSKVHSSAGLMSGNFISGQYPQSQQFYPPQKPSDMDSYHIKEQDSLISAQKSQSSSISDDGQKKYTLLGLLDIIRLHSQDRTTVALGIDLTGLGLNLNVNEPLHSTFMSPFAIDPSMGADPVYSIPNCYNVPERSSALLSRIPSLPDETLFYIFYSMPREAYQEASAQALYLRGWRFHKELGLWLTRDPLSSVYVKGAGFERGIYVFFDPTSWTRIKKEWLLYFDHLEERSNFQQ